MIATCSVDKMVIVWKVITRNIFQADAGLLEVPEISIMAKHDAHKSEVWRLSWNVLGTCVASSGEDGTVRVFKKNFKGSFA